ncbi:hypothetical protein BCEN4_360017 [Burkholderia cenocepacia]|nr:hypothetical protein BCEN4_360017 [Burkholderia cenocepacia]
MLEWSRHLQGPEMKIPSKCLIVKGYPPLPERLNHFTFKQMLHCEISMRRRKSVAQTGL